MHSENQYNRYLALKNIGFVPKRILDVGAYHGNWSLMMKEIYPDASFSLVEANKNCLELIKKNGFDDVKIAVAGECEKLVDFYVCQTGCEEGNSVFKEKSCFPFVKTQRKTTTLNELFPKQSFDLIKIDAQGSERNIVLGGVEIVTKASFVQLETQIQQYNAGAPFLINVINFMHSIGFRVYDIIDHHYNSGQMLIQSDILFANMDLQLFYLDCYS